MFRRVMTKAMHAVGSFIQSRALLSLIFFTFSIPSIVVADLLSNASVITPIPLYGSGIIILLQPPIEFPPITPSRLDIYGDLLCPDYRDFVENVESKIDMQYISQLVTHLFGHT